MERKDFGRGLSLDTFLSDFIRGQIAGGPDGIKLFAPNVTLMSLPLKTKSNGLKDDGFGCASNDGLFQNIHKPGIMLKQMHHNPPYHRILLKLYTDPDHERRTFSILASRAMAYSKFVHPLGKSRGYGR